MTWLRLTYTFQSSGLKDIQRTQGNMEKTKEINYKQSGTINKETERNKIPGAERSNN